MSTVNGPNVALTAGACLTGSSLAIRNRQSTQRNRLPAAAACRIEKTVYPIDQL